MRLVIALALLTGACVDELVAGEPDAISHGALTETHVESALLEQVEPSICDLLPDEGACSLACDPAALAEQYVPSGACAVFGCTLTDGRTIHVHACSP